MPLITSIATSARVCLNQSRRQFWPSYDKPGAFRFRQRPIAIEFAGCQIDEGFRVDLVVEGILLGELKSVEHLAPVHYQQVLTYLRLMHLPIGRLINFGAPTFREGIKRLVHDHRDFASSRLRVNAKSPG